MRRRVGRLALAIMLWTAGSARALAAQHVRVSGVTTFEYLEARPLADDSVPLEAALGSGLLRRSPEGYIVRCVTDDPFCRFRRVMDRARTVPAIQEISVSAWGIAPGVRAYGRLRGRAVLTGEETLWPRGDDRVDLLAAYVEIARPAFRIRAGRQWKASGLGFYDFDGAAVLVRPLRGLTVEAYGGWGLVRGIHEPVTSDEVLDLEPFAPDARPYVVGAQLGIRPHRAGALTALYQREIRDDRLGLYAERLSVDGVLHIGAASIEADVNADIATGALNEVRARAWLPPIKSVSLGAFYRHHRPFFELWTIWGAFSPVGFDEAGVRAAWRRPGGPVSLELSGAGRRYGEADAQTLFGSVRTTAWRLATAMTAQLAPHWLLETHYQADVGFGAAKSDGGVRLQRRLGNDAFVALNAGAFQRLYEFREDESIVLLAGVDAGARLGPRARVRGTVSTYRHDTAPGLPDTDWMQLRASLRFEWIVGTEPHLPYRAGSRP